jgi:NAD(P)-dependent dehydrogenase (short-subunit alcohol dehydrogenase family)
MGGQIAFPGLSLYHTSKWAVEGFLESTAQDIAPFNIQTTLVEPGGARTGFFSSGSTAYGQALPEYANTPAGAARKRIEGGSYIPPGDPAKMVRAIAPGRSIGRAFTHPIAVQLLMVSVRNQPTVTLWMITSSFGTS